jgi:hypothetical protein
VKANNKDLVERLQCPKLEICENFAADSMTDVKPKFGTTGFQKVCKLHFTKIPRGISRRRRKKKKKKKKGVINIRPKSLLHVQQRKKL